MPARATKPYANGKNDKRRGLDFIGLTCAFICHDGKGRILMHKRSKNCRDEQGNWDIGAGAHEFGDNIKDTVRREIREEYGVKATNLSFIKVYDAHRKLEDGTATHWVCILYSAKVDPKKVNNNEPFKIDEIGWFNISNLPSPLHSQVGHSLKTAIKLGLIK